MRKSKPFDCVQMKWEIQQKIASEFGGVSEEEALRIQSERIAQNPILGPFLKKVRLSSREAAQKPI